MVETREVLIVMKEETLSTRKGLKIGAVVLGYWTVSISMVFANKYLVGDRKASGDIALFVAWTQCVVTVLVVLALKGGKSVLQYMRSGTWDFVLDLRRGTSRELLMMTFTFVAMLSFNNLCLKNVGVAFFQVARSMTLIFVVIFSVTLLKKSMSIKIFFSCFCVAGGFALGVDQENLAGTLSVQGVAFGIVTSFFAALNGIFTKKALHVVEHDSIQLTLLCNFNASILFLPILIFSGTLDTALNSPILHDYFFWIFLVCTGALGFLIAWVSALQIDWTSPVTHHISANSKAVLQTLIAVAYYEETKRPLWWCSMLMVVGGATSYAIFRIREEKSVKVVNNNDPNTGLQAEKRNFKV